MLKSVKNVKKCKRTFKNYRYEEMRKILKKKMLKYRKTSRIFYNS